MPCENIQTRIDEINAEIRALQAELHDDGTGRPPSVPIKWAILRQINGLRQQLPPLGAELNQCLIEHNVARPLATTLCGEVTLSTTYPEAEGRETVCLGLSFNAARNELSINSFPPIAPSFLTPFGMNTTVVSMIGQRTGGFDPISGAAVLNLQLRFDHSIEIPAFFPEAVEEDSNTTSFSLSTGTIAGISGPLSGSSLNRATRRMKLVGSFTFVGGIPLNGHTGNIIFDGMIADLP